MTTEYRRIARRMRRAGFRARHLGQLDDQGWDRVRVLLDVEDAPNIELADAVDHLVRCEEGLADVEQIADAPSVLDNYGLTG